MTEMTHMLLIPANDFLPCVVLELETEDGLIDGGMLRDAIGCRTFEQLHIGDDSPLAQLVDTFPERITVALDMFGDEEGRLVQMPLVNGRATRLLGWPMRAGSAVVGNVVIVGFDPNTGNTIGLEAEALLTMLQEQMQLIEP